MTLIPLFNLALRNLASLHHNDGARFGEVRGQLRRLRREHLPTYEELDRRYLDEAKDLYELEQRMRELDRPRRPTWLGYPLER